MADSKGNHQDLPGRLGSVHLTRDTEHARKTILPFDVMNRRGSENLGRLFEEVKI